MDRDFIPVPIYKPGALDLFHTRVVSLFFFGSEWFRPGGYITATPASTPVKIGDDTEGGMDPTLSEPRRRCEHIAGTALQIPLKQAWSASADGGDLTPPK